MSPEVQEKLIRACAATLKLNVEICVIYESGKDFDARPQFQAALAKARAKGNVIFSVWDRTGRNLTDHEQLERSTCAPANSEYTSLRKAAHTTSRPAVPTGSRPT